MKSSDKDKRLDELIKRATDGNEHRFMPDFDRWLKDHPDAVQRLNTSDEPALGRELPHQNGAGHQSLLTRYPRLTWAFGIAALITVTASCMLSLFLAKRVADLKHELDLAKRDIAVARTEGRLEEAHNVRQENISTLYHRVEELEGRIPRISPASRGMDQIEPYYYPAMPDSL